MDSHSFRELDLRELLNEEDYFAFHSPRALLHLRSNADLFNSHFCDEEYYVPVKKRTPCFQDAPRPPPAPREAGTEGEEPGSAMMRKQKKTVPPIPQVKEYDQKTIIKVEKQQKPDLMSQMTASDKATEGKGVLEAEIQRLPVKSMLWTKSESSQKQELSLVLLGRKYYISLHAFWVEATQENIRSIYEQLTERELWVPAYNYSRLQEWTAAQESLRFHPDHEAHRLFRASLTHYLAYLHRAHSSHLPAILSAVFEARQAAAKCRSSGRSGLEVLWGALESLRSYLKHSRGEALRLALLGKWRAVHEGRKQALRWPELALLAQELAAEEEQLWQRIGQAELLACLEETERQCEKRAQEGGRRWGSYKAEMRRQLEGLLAAIGEMPI